MAININNCKPHTDISYFLHYWHTMSDYVAQERALNSIFLNGANFFTQDELMIKCSALNDFYSTNIFKIYYVVRHYLSIANMGCRLALGDLSLVSDLRMVPMPTQPTNLQSVKASVKTAQDLALNTYLPTLNTKRDLYSFATKFCSHHNPEAFPIYDRNVDKALRAFRKRDHFFSFNNGDLKCYPKFVKIINAFRDYYKLSQYSYKDIDRYLWLLGSLL